MRIKRILKIKPRNHRCMSQDIEVLWSDGQTQWLTMSEAEVYFNQLVLKIRKGKKITEKELHKLADLKYEEGGYNESYSHEDDFHD